MVNSCMKTKILICGLPGSGKTTIANTLSNRLIALGYVVCYLNADELREFHDDWDFGAAGRVRQAIRMRDLAHDSSADFVIADFVAPLPQIRSIFQSDFTIFMDTIKEGRFADTNALFEPPDFADVKATTFDASSWANTAIGKLRSGRRV